ncbi:unnamed protein product, partial [Larinioides sclopetarius]
LDCAQCNWPYRITKWAALQTSFICLLQPRKIHEEQLKTIYLSHPDHE